MLIYNLNSLGWYNYERLTGTLMKDILGPGVEAFGGTKDDGRDCIFRGKAPYPSSTDQWEGTWIIQVKFTNSEQVGAKNAERGIIGSFNTELASIDKRRKLSFNNYLLVTNVPISAAGRDKIEKLFLLKHPTLHFRIIDGKDVCDFLTSKSQIRQSFPQLLGLADLSKILNHEIYEKAEAYLEIAKIETAAFVRHQHYETALEVLNKKHFVVLDGPPEVGKTTIAYAIALRYAASGYHVVDIGGSSTAFFKAYDVNQPMIFIADDAVGSITFEPDLGEMWSQNIAKILIKLGTKHKLIWTTRRYILEDALARTKLNEAVPKFPDENDVIVSVDQYSSMERAEMLYNHTKIRNLNEDARAGIKKAAIHVIMSNDFTPLRIRQFLDDILPDLIDRKMAVDDIANEFFTYCKNPNERWYKAFNNLTETEKILLISLIDCGGNASHIDLKACFVARCNQLDLSIDFDRCLQKLRNSFIKEVPYFVGHSRIQFQHPSLRDMVLRRVHSDSKSRNQYIKLASISSITSIVSNLLENSNLTDQLHEVVVDSAEAKDALIIRISQIGIGSIEASKWASLIQTLTVLADEIDKSNTTETQIQIAKEVINQVVLTTSNKDFYNAHERWSPSNWNQIIDGLTKILTNKYIKSEGPTYWVNLSSLFSTKANFYDGIKFVSLAMDWVPGIIQREMKEAIIRWKEDAENEAKEGISEAPDEREDCKEQDFNEWWDRTNSSYLSLKRLNALNIEHDSDLIDQLDEKHDNIVVVPDDDDDDGEDYAPPVDEIDDWTINKLLEDI